MRFESGWELGGVQTMSLDLTVIIGYMTPSASMPASPPASICFPSIPWGLTSLSPAAISKFVCFFFFGLWSQNLSTNYTYCFPLSTIFFRKTATKYSDDGFEDGFWSCRRSKLLPKLSLSLSLFCRCINSKTQKHSAASKTKSRSAQLLKRVFFSRKVESLQWVLSRLFFFFFFSLSSREWN